MIKKSSKKKQVNLCRDKDGVYQMPSDIIATIEAFSNPPRESLCDEARRLVDEAKEKARKDRAEKELELIVKIFGPDWAERGVTIDKVRDDGTIEYLICGRRWIATNRLGWRFLGVDRLVCVDEYMGFVLEHHVIVDLQSFGEALQDACKHEAALRIKYPDNLWGRFKARVAHLFLNTLDFLG